MRAFLLLALALGAACSQRSEPTPRNGGDSATTARPDPSPVPADGSVTMSNDSNRPGGTGVDEHGNLLRGKPENNPPPPAFDPAILADHDAHLLYYAGAASGDQAMMKRVWTQLGIADAAGAPNARFGEFMAAHQQWVSDNPDKAQTVGTAAKAKEYLAKHLR